MSGLQAAIGDETMLRRHLQSIFFAISTIGAKRAAATEVDPIREFEEIAASPDYSPSSKKV